MLATRRGRAVAVLLVAFVALVGAAGCGRLPDQAADDTTDLSWDQQALVSMGVADVDLAASAGAAPSADHSGGPRVRHPRLRFLFRNTLHGEVTIQTEDGRKTVVAQRGEVTDVTASTLTVKSSDGFTLTWALSDRTAVIINRTRVAVGDVKTGAKVGVAGARDGDTVTARLVVVPRS